MKYFLLTLLVLAGCSPKLVVHNLDSTYEEVAVQIDQELAGTLSYGESLSERLPRGPHHVDAHPVGQEFNPWNERGQGWVVYLDEGAYLTLLPVAKSERNDEKKIAKPRVPKLSEKVAIEQIEKKKKTSSEPEEDDTSDKPELDNPYGE